ncbi:F-box protein CPR1 [Jatropha curcas]|uniref:F-box protein CPR1 n=1 Tax=Jatropha curcas TaxID=180498 RepID=UPI0009D6EA3B|nr:F-box protein CPR1 [Jatropha curcas]
MSDYLSEEVITKILHNLPVKSLIRCTSVCKLWYSLIKNPHFISAQIAKTSLINIESNPNRLLLSHIHADEYSVGFENQELKKYIPLHFPFKSGSRLPHAMGYSNGLLCLLDRRVALGRYEDKFILWNPSIRKSFTVPQPNFAFSLCVFCNDYVGFGFDSNTNDYKVLRMMIHLNEHHDNDEELKFQIEIYSFNMNSWKIVTGDVPTDWIENQWPYGSRLRLIKRAACLNNALHWIVNHSKYKLILVFDMKDEVLREIMLPECLAKDVASQLCLKVFRDSSIAVINSIDLHSAHIWVMKEYRVVESWEKLIEVDGDQRRGRLTVLGFKRNGEVIPKFFRKPLTLSSAYASIDTYVESLALLDKGNAVEEKRPKRARRSDTEII